MAEKVDFGPRLGADPELFVIAKKGSQYNKNTIVPVCGLVGGTKDAPVTVTHASLKNYLSLSRPPKVGNFAYQEDNVMFEFNIPAATTPDEFVYYVNGFRHYLLEQILSPKNLMFAHTNKHTFPVKLLTNPLSRIIGCSPDYYAYHPQNDMMRMPYSIEDLGNQRFCGGHLHVQYNFNNVPRSVFAKFMDLAVSIPFLALDKQPERRKFYGKAGLFRPKEYGIEYRTPSNWWVIPDNVNNSACEYMAKNVLQLARLANEQPTNLSSIFSKIPWGDVKKAIEEEDTKLAVELFDHTGPLLAYWNPIYGWVNGRITGRND